MSRSLSVCLLVLAVLVGSSFTGCNDGGNKVVEQTDEVMTEEFLSEEMAASSGEDSES